MKTHPVFRQICLMMAVLHLAACSPSYLPARMSDVTEAYPPEILSDTSAVTQREATVETMYDAPYDTVFRAIRVAVTEGGYTIESENRQKGVVLATREETIPPINPGSNPTNDTVKSFLGVNLSEVGPERTQVNLYHKKQGHCRYVSGPQTTAGCIVSLMIICPVLVPVYYVEKDNCEDHALLKPGWHGYTNPLKQIKNYTDKYLLRGGDI